MIMIDKLCYTSRLRYISPSSKALFAVATLFICIADRSFITSALVLCVMSYLTVCKGQIAASRYVRLMCIPLVFLFFSTLALIVNFSSVPMDAFAISLGKVYLTGSYDTLCQAARLILTAFAGVSCLYFLSLSTTITDLLGVLQKLRMPSLITELMLLTYRFLFILLDLGDALSTAQQSRLGNRNVRSSYRSFGSLVSVLFINAFKKSSFLYDAMESRCYDGKLRVLKESYPIQKKHLFLIFLFELFLIFLSLLLRHLKLHY